MDLSRFLGPQFITDYIINSYLATVKDRLIRKAVTYIKKPQQRATKALNVSRVIKMRMMMILLDYLPASISASESVNYMTHQIILCLRNKVVQSHTRSTC